MRHKNATVNFLFFKSDRDYLDATASPYEPHLLPLDGPERVSRQGFTREKCSNCQEVWVGYSSKVHCTCGSQYEGGKFVGKVGTA